jgi:hypothetical protein
MIGWGEMRLIDLTLKDDQLLAAEAIFGDEVGFTAREGHDGAEPKRVTGGLGEVKLVQGKKQQDRTIGSGDGRG